jgi:hypothetical protein
MRERFERLAAEHPEQVVRFTAGPPSAAAAAPSDTVSRLERLAALRDRGILSEGEFEAEKAKILRDG